MVGQDDPPETKDSLNAIPSGKTEAGGTKSEVSIDVEGATLQGTLLILPRARAGWSFSPMEVAAAAIVRETVMSRRCLNSQGIATLLFDLLTRKEESIDQYTGELRFDIPFLAKRWSTQPGGLWVSRAPRTFN